MANLFIDKRNASGPVDEWGHEGNDRILGSRFGDELKGAQGNDTIEGNAGDDVIMDVTWVGFKPNFGAIFTASRFTDSGRLLISNSVPDNLEVSFPSFGTQLFHGGNDRFFGGDGDDYLLGFGGDDRLDGGDDLDVLLGGTGQDFLAGGEGDDILAGNIGNDTLQGGDGNDLLNGGFGNDRLEGGKGGDRLIGGDGIDTAAYDNSLAGVHVNLQYGTYALDTPRFSDVIGDSLESIENVDGSRFDDVISGTSGVNDLWGGLGNDVLLGAAGADILDGSAGTDTVAYFGSRAGVDVALASSTSSTGAIGRGGDAQGDVLISIENLSGTSFGDRLVGNSSDNRFLGFSGNDELRGEAGRDHLEGWEGNDTLSGGDNDDFLIGGTGSDLLDGGEGIDTASFADLSARLFVELKERGSDGRAISTEPGTPFRVAVTDTLRSIEKVIGTAFDDEFFGNSERNTFNGGEGADTFHYSIGGDTIDGDGGIDTLDMSGLKVGVTATLGGSFTTAITLDQGFVRDIENILTGSFNDTITGSFTDNRIEAGGGVDIMSGLAGNDTFVFTSITDSGLERGERDVITDFTAGDRLDLTAIDTVPEIDGDQIFVFLGEGRFTGSGGEIRATANNGGNMLVAIDLDGDRQADSRIQLDGVSELLGSDFLL
ncbi:calcium-binding protein [Rhizobium alvei]|uniref:Calcium-binding protein n=1 Tax=Rhizobium alvei TaxID=1132659 RepID=A0ABT8YGM6_9HYPH|nr:calcium-binding protein [Rhizobium alvei]MDO6962836.1 calcium-binding protein [Rhizobium alvei]